MPRGQQPKDPEARRRRNKAATEAVLTADDGAKVKVPTLTQEILGARVHASTKRWWATIWKSPMAPRWLPSDVEGLYLLAILRNEFFMKPTATLAGEIRQHEARFGLTPVDRKRLDWRIQGPQQTEPMKPAPVLDDVPEPENFDPRAVLRAVK